MRTRTATTRLAVTLTVAAFVVPGCGASDPVAEVRDRPLDERLVDVEARRLCALQTTSFSDPADREAFTDRLFEEVDVTRDQWEAFRAELASDPSKASQVSDLFDELCG